ncbi:hypothetical protein ACFS07_22955 [Undibacterium arcticum]
MKKTAIPVCSGMAVFLFGRQVSSPLVLQLPLPLRLKFRLRRCRLCAKQSGSEMKKMSERSELFSFPALLGAQTGTRRAASARSPFFAYFFFGEAKKK